MTTEDDFRAALDAAPDCYQNLAVFADWLRDRDDPRADGYAALAALRRVPYNSPGSNGLKTPFGWLWLGDEVYDPSRRVYGRDVGDGTLPYSWWKQCRTKHTRACEAFDAAARAFVNLPADKRAELLTLHGTTV